MKPVISFERTFVFSIKIVKTLCSQLLIGILDKDKRKEDRYSLYTGDAVSFCTNGQVYPGCVNVGGQLKNGDIVHTSVKLSEGIVEWKVNKCPIFIFEQTVLQ